jgi:lycopene cyclase domain-containing protein
MSNFEYLILLLIAFLPTFLLTFHPSSELKQDIKTAIFTITIVAIPWIIWDFFATERGHWAFNSDYYLGFKVFNLPFEEVLFFFAIPYSCLYLWAVIRDFETFEKLIQKLKQIKISKS